MSDALHDSTPRPASLRPGALASGVTPSTAWSDLPVGESRFQQVRRQLRVLQVQRVALGLHAA